jgi:moderate conductance mechanosensitive channel
MNTRKRTKSLILIFIIGALILGISVSFLCTHIATSEQKQYSHTKLKLIDSLIQDSKASETEITKNYDQQYQSKADSVAFMAKNANFSCSNSQLAKLRDILNVDYIAIKNASGSVIAKDGTVPDKSKEPHTYTAKIDGSHTVVIIHNIDTLSANLAVNASLSNVLDDIHVGQNGFAFAVHAVKKTILYYPKDKLIGDKASDHGIDISKMKDGSDLNITIDGTKYFCSVKKIDNGLIATAVPYSEISANRNMTIAIALIIYTILAGMIILYCTFLHGDHQPQEENLKNKFGEPNSPAKYNRPLGNKIICIAVIGSLLTFGVTYYTQTLLTLSQQSITSNARGTEMLKTLSANDDTIATETTQYQNQCLEKVRLGAYIIKNTDSSALTQKYMISLKKALQVNNLTLFNSKGKVQASDSKLWSFSLSKDKKNQTYQFWSILNGTKDEVVQDIQKDDEGNLKQYIGKAILNSKHKTVGMLEIGVTPDALSKATLNTDLATVLKGIQVGKSGFAFAVDTKTNTFAYFPEKELINQDITDYGMTENMVKADYNDFITIDGTRYYCASGKFSHYITYIAVPFSSMNKAALPVSALATVVMFLFMIILWWMFSFDSFDKKFQTESEENSDSTISNVASAPDKTNNPKDVVNVDLGDGRTKTSRSVTSRWSHRGIPWEDMNAGQKTFFILNKILMVLAFVILISVIFANNIFDDNSLIRFILRGKWQHGVNIFSITYCILMTISIIEVTIIARRFVMWVAEFLNARGETICRMLDNFLRTFSVLFIIYYCLSTLGVDTKTLLASAGILSLVIGLGAQSLVSDILAGLFIIFESEFQVGDIVTIDGFRGTVVEIGIRTTKIKEGAGNVKIFSNSSVKNILNMTKDYSVISVDMIVKYSEDLHYIEKALRDEFPKIKNNLPAIVEGPFYRGVSAQDMDTMTIRIIAKCLEKDRVQLDRDLRRQMKLVFDEHDINILSSQIGAIRPKTEDDKVAELKERIQNRQADNFVKQQTEEFEKTDITED